MKIFYDKEIYIYLYGETEDEFGVTREGYAKFITTEPIMADIQPYSLEKAEKVYGYTIECTKRLFMDTIPEITESCIVKYKDDKYLVQKIIEWEDYEELLLLETEVDINE